MHTISVSDVHVTKVKLRYVRKGVLYRLNEHNIKAGTILNIKYFSSVIFRKNPFNLFTSANKCNAFANVYL